MSDQTVSVAFTNPQTTEWSTADVSEYSGKVTGSVYLSGGPNSLNLIFAETIDKFTGDKTTASQHAFRMIAMLEHVANKMKALEDAE